jgi:tetratricopeptide (TPR) repeat protein
MSSKRHHTVWLTLTWLLCSVAIRTSAAPNGNLSLTNFIAHAHTNLVVARQQFTIAPTNSVAAWQLGRACFTWGKLLTDRTEQEKIYTEGVNACRRSLGLDPKSAPANYYLGMNIGRVADLKRNLSAFNMVKDVEKSFQRARQIDEKFASAGADRNLGLLYQNAPGWPLSVGDKKLARKHLQRAVELAADYPENRLNLAEAALDWKDRKLIQNELDALEKIWPRAKTNLTGLDWEFDWRDWEKRRADLQRKIAPK